MLTQQYFDRFYDWVVRPAKDASDIERVHDFAVAHFGATAFPVTQLADWHERYPLGRMLLCDRDRVVGYISLWPITAEQATVFCAGTLSEKNLLPIVVEEVFRNPVQHWFISSMVIAPELRKPIKDNPIGMLLAMALNHWAESGQLQYPIDVFTAAFSAEGAALIKRFGFEQIRSAAETVDGEPIWQRIAKDKNQLFELFAKHGIPNLFANDSAVSTPAARNPS
jgi:hypothetical protein